MPLRRELDRLFEDFFMPAEEGGGNVVWSPRTDLAETDDEYLLTMDLPGLKKDDVKVDFQEGQLAISGERRQEKKEQEKNYHRRERSYGSFYRSMTLPQNVNAEDIQASFEDGVLKVHIPKAEESKPKRIEIS